MGFNITAYSADWYLQKILQNDILSFQISTMFQLELPSAAALDRRWNHEKYIYIFTLYLPANKQKGNLRLILPNKILNWSQLTLQLTLKVLQRCEAKQK